MRTKQLFAGTGTLSKFILRRDRLRLAIWIFSLSVFMVILVPVFADMILSGGDKSVMVEMMKNPAMIAIVGPVYGEANYTLGAAYANYMLLFSVIFAAVMNIFLVTRHTREDEELGRLEVIRSLPVGRLANLASTLSVALAANLLLSALTALGLYAMRGEGMAWAGCLIFGFSLGAVGMFFAAATAVFSQLTANNRTATALTFMLLLVLYLLRGAGDLGRETLSLISPLGLILRSQTFVHDYAWPVLAVAGISLATALLAFYLAGRRDLGRGLLPEKPGRRHAAPRLASPLSLAFKLIRTPLILWSLIIFILAGMYGSVFGDLEGYIASSEMLRAIFSENLAYSLTEQFFILLMAIMTMFSTVPVLNFANRVAAEEKSGMAEHVLAKAVSRKAQMTAYFLPAVLMSVIFQVLAALGFWTVGSTVLETIPPLGTFIQAAVLYLPAVWAMLGIAALLIGFKPERTSLVYIYLGITFLIIYLGRLSGFPEWSRKLTPFGYVSQYPIESADWLQFALLTAVAGLFITLGYLAYRRRDLRTQA